MDVQSQESQELDVNKDTANIGEGDVAATTIETSDANQVQPVDQYTPNFSYEFRTLEGAREKKEFDDRLKQIIKSKEDEEFVRQLVTKADGLDVNKRNLKQYEEKYTGLEKDYHTLKSDVDFVLEARDRGDFWTVANALGLSKKQIREAVYRDLQADDLTPEQKKQYDKSYELETASYHSNRKIHELESKLQSFELQSRKSELEAILNQNDISPIAEDFDRRNGPNAFWNEVVTRGAMFEQMGVMKKPTEVINEIINLYSLKTPQVQPKAPSVSNKSLPVLPNTGSGGSTVPLKKKPTSLGELKDLARGLED